MRGVVVMVSDKDGCERKKGMVREGKERREGK